jgi:hypothetical protein
MKVKKFLLKIRIVLQIELGFDFLCSFYVK